MTNWRSRDNYSARTAYQDADIVETYEKDRFSGILGRYRWRREQEALRELVLSLPQVETILDCPCGIGRWWPLLAERAQKIIGVDISQQMLERAAREQISVKAHVDLMHGDAECLELDDGVVDYVFCHALAKHLPIPAQSAALQEFARVARSGVIYSVGVLGRVTYEFWRRRNLVESYPLLPEQLNWLAADAGLRVARLRKCSTPIGVEHAVLLLRT